MVAVADVKEALRVSDADLADASDAFVDLEELVLGHDANRLDQHQDRLVILSTLHVVWNTHFHMWLHKKKIKSEKLQSK